MQKKLQAIRGMNDILPQETPAWQYVENILRRLATTYGYQEIRFPILEKTELFKRSVGEVTDIVEKEMYTFEDRNGDSLSLRPEGTAGCVRAAQEAGLLYNQIQKLWYIGPLYRHERPQKGRYRQFHQFGLEAFGMKGPEIDAEIILFCARLWKALGLTDFVKLEINSLGSAEERAAYRDVLVDYLKQHEAGLDEDSKRRLTTNPLRILDTKNPEMKSIVDAAPKMIDHLSDESKSQFDRLCELLKAAGVDYVLNPNLVRGLDYYCHTVFEWVTDSLGAQGTVCAGGRFDGLVEMLGGKATPAIGFALGLERLILMLTDLKLLPAFNTHAEVFLIAVGGAAQTEALVLAEQLRNEYPGLNVLLNCAGGSFKSQMKKADQSGAKLALIIGDEELESQSVSVKYLREEKPQEKISRKALVQDLAGLL